MKDEFGVAVPVWACGVGRRGTSGVRSEGSAVAAATHDERGDALEATRRRDEARTRREEVLEGFKARERSGELAVMKRQASKLLVSSRARRREERAAASQRLLRA